MITLPFEYKSGTTLLAELDAEHYITNRKKVIAKLTADNLWEKPVKPIKPVGELILLDNEYAELVADWKAFQAWATDNVTKHLAGQHDQSTHAGGRKSYGSIDDLVKDAESIQDAVDKMYIAEIGEAANGNVPMRVLLERMGKGGKPQSVASIDDLDGEAMYRGTSDENDNNFRNADYDRIGVGHLGDGYYFASQLEIAEQYKRESLNDKLTVAGWKKDAKVMKFGSSHQVEERAMFAGEAAIRELKINTNADDNQWATHTNFFFTNHDSLVTSLIQEGYDGMYIDFSEDLYNRNVTEGYTIVFNREALQVVDN